ncbi:MAG: hypothetical protein A2V74_06565 [Acidobacteria bacterium RBG_16_70_10]|nr:MAG: hypothetical protein A2V74_06565 [Acidobacteria bacterium RBG_16_70_10]
MCGKSRRRDELARGEERRPLDGGAELAHVAGPEVTPEQIRGLGRKAGGGGRAPLAFPTEKQLCQRQDVLPAFPQWWQPEGDHIEPVVEVLAEAAGAHGLCEVDVGGRHEADVDVDGAGSAQPLEAALLDDPQELGLQRGGEVLELVEIQGAPGRHLDLARLGLSGVGEGPPLVPEQLRL